MTASGNQRIRARVIGGAFLICAIPVALMYYKAPSVTKPIAYGVRFSSHWFRLSDGDLEKSLRDGILDRWTLQVVRAPLGRWRLRPMTTAPFDNIMADYSRGLWSVPLKPVWEREFSKLDSLWCMRRKRAVTAGLAMTTIAPPDGGRLSQRFMEVRFPASGFDVAEIGSLIELRATLPRGTSATQPVWMEWEFANSLTSSSISRRQCTVRLDGSTSDDQLSILAEADLSWEPNWMAPGTVLRSIRWTCDSFERWTINHIAFGDSRLLCHDQKGWKRE